MSTYFDEENKIWHAKDSPIVFNPKISLGHSILWTLGNNPNKIIQINHETNIQLTGGFIRQQTIRAALNLRNHCCETGDIIGFMANYLAPIFYASLCLACPVSPLDPSFTKPEVMHMFSITQPKVVFCDVSVYDLMRGCLDELENGATVFTFSGQSGDSIPVERLFEETEKENKFIVAEIDAENTTAAIVCTSGSTGLSKGVAITHAILLHQVSGLSMQADDIVLSFSTIYWISGILFLIANALKTFCRLLTTERFTPELVLDIIEEHRVTFFSSASYGLVLMLKSDRLQNAKLTSLRCVISSGSKLSAGTALEMAKYLKNCVVGQIYGMTEVGGCTSVGIIRTAEDTSVGQLLLGIRIKITDDDGNRLGLNECGEICTRTKYKFLGYYKNEEATSDAIDDEGFLRTGDIGYFDGSGNLHLVDRKKDMIKYCSSQVSPTEIEQYLFQFSSIEAVCVVGIPDSEVGDLPAAVIIRNENEEPISQNEVEQLIADCFADYKRLRGGVYFIDSMPLTPSGKIIRRRIREIAIEMYGGENMVPDF